MARASHIGWAAAAMAAVLVAQVAQAAQGVAQQSKGPKAEEKAQSTTAQTREIVVSLDDRKLALVEDGQVVKVYPVAVGKPSTPSPEGTFTIERRVANPTYHHDGRTIPPGPGNPVGTRWMGLSIKGYGIHGTNDPRSIGKAASHGCIRMAKADLENLYPQVAVGDSVEFIGHRNEETARLFGEGAMPGATAQPVLAKSAPLPAAEPALATQSAPAEAVPAAAVAAANELNIQNGLEALTAAILTGAL
jgi:lipoprotein-anchoring transpeptidase ErfK/SrfK